jgi:hypothetical protein
MLVYTACISVGRGPDLQLDRSRLLARPASRFMKLFLDIKFLLEHIDSLVHSHNKVLHSSFILLLVKNNNAVAQWLWR